MRGEGTVERHCQTRDLPHICFSADGLHAHRMASRTFCVWPTTNARDKHPHCHEIYLWLQGNGGTLGCWVTEYRPHQHHHRCKWVNRKAKTQSSGISSHGVWAHSAPLNVRKDIVMPNSK